MKTKNSRRKFIERCCMRRYSKEDPFALPTKILRLCGISLNEEDGILFKIYSFCIVVGTLSLSVSAIITIMVNRGRTDVFVENILFACSYLISSVKTLSILFVRKRLMKALKLLQNPVFTPNFQRGGEIEEQILARQMFYANMQQHILTVLTVTIHIYAHVATTALTLFQGDFSNAKLPFGDVVIFNVTYSPVYELMCLYQTIFSFPSTLGYGSANMFFASIMIFLNAQCYVLQNFIKSSVKYCRSEMEKIQSVKYASKPLARERNARLTAVEVTATEWRYLHKRLKEIVYFHIAITDAISEFANLYSIAALIDFLGLSNIICLAVFYSTFMPSINFRILQLITLAIGCTYIQFITAFWGTELTFQNMEIASACSEIDYYTTEIRFQKALSFIIQRAQKPVHFTVSKFTPLTVETTILVIKIAYSCFMMLHHLNSDAHLNV